MSDARQKALEWLRLDPHRDHAAWYEDRADAVATIEAALLALDGTNALQAALRVAAKEFCSNKCLTTFTSPDQPRHISECVAMQKMIRAAREGSDV